MGRRQGLDRPTLDRHFGADSGLLPLWIAEPDLELSGNVRRALEERARAGWYGYETRPSSVIASFWDWAHRRHRWDGRDLHTAVSPSVGTSIGVLVDQLSAPGDGVIVQPPVFTDFKPMIVAGGRTPVRNPLVLTDDGYRMDLDDLAAKASDRANRLLILCSPHNPVGRVWTRGELAAVASICAEHEVIVVADEIHADLALPPHRFVPFALAAADSAVRWAATHGPIKTFGLAGVCDTVLITDDDEIVERFQLVSSRLHLTRNNVFAIAAFEASYREGEPWLDELLTLVSGNVARLEQGLPPRIGLVRPEGTYLAWLDLGGLGLEVPEIPRWLATAGLALSPGHWFGREGAGFARMTIAVPADVIDNALDRLRAAARRS